MNMKSQPFEEEVLSYLVFVANLIYRFNKLLSRKTETVTLKMRLLIVKKLKNYKFLPSPFLVNSVAPVSNSLAFGPHPCTSIVNASVGGWPSGSTGYPTPMFFPKMLNGCNTNKRTTLFEILQSL